MPCDLDLPDHFLQIRQLKHFLQEYNEGEVVYLPLHLRGGTVSVCPITGDAKLDCLVKQLPGRSLEREDTFGFVKRPSVL